MTSPEGKLSTCGCCQAALEHLSHYNRPGQSEISYRLDSHAGFLRRMMGSIHQQRTPNSAKEPPLSALTVRSSDDPTIAILDAWAMVSDVLAFYQERIANEGFLRTAAERRSVLEIARSIGYELKPGVAASAYLAFTAEETLGTPKVVMIPEKTRVRSIPEPGKLPQTFETVEGISARADWNILTPWITALQDIGPGTLEIYLQGMDIQLQKGDGILLVGDEREQQGGEGSERWDFRILDTVEPIPEMKCTRVSWKEGLGSEKPPSLPAKNPRVFAFRQKASLFGYNAPDARVLRDLIVISYSGNADYSSKNIDKWPNFIIASAKEDKRIYLDAVYPKIMPSSWIVLMRPNYVELYKAKSVAADSRSDLTLTAKTTRIEPDVLENLEGFYKNRRQTVVFAESEELLLAEAPFQGLIEGDRIELNRPVYGLESGKVLILSGKRKRAQVIGENLSLLSDDEICKPLVPENILWVLAVRASWWLKKVAFKGSIETSVHDIFPLPQTAEDKKLNRKRAKVKKDGLKLKGEAKEIYLNSGDVVEVIDCKYKWRLIDGDGFIGSVTAGSGEILLQPVKDKDDTINEAVVLDRESQAGGRTTLILKEPMKNQYDPSTVQVYCNVALATHGESVEEVLGSGDGSMINQFFKLKKPPLTFVSSPTPSGVRSTLTVRVGGVLWEETSSLLRLDERSQNYILRLDDDANASIVFGDGIRGARLTTGDENISASYRSGIGLDGEVMAGSLKLLQNRPQGIREVFNPLPASGAAPAEKLSDARRNAPLTVLTMDRIVSLQDYENFARSFAGIGKAHATSVPLDQGRMVHITIASSSGRQVHPGSELFENLSDAIDAIRDPVQRAKEQLSIDSFFLKTFSVKAGILVDLRYRTDEVLIKVKTEIMDAFSFENRSFGQPVTAAEVLKIMQAVPGVIAVDLDMLERDDSPPQSGQGGATPTTILKSEKARFSGNRILPAELLLLNLSPKGVVLYELEVSNS